jgi:hypothetical protein
MQVQGFSAAAVPAGIRYPDRLDLGLIFSRVPAVTAGVFTTSKVKAAPLQLDMERLRSGMAQAVLVNSGNANACTGAAGMAAARAVGSFGGRCLGDQRRHWSRWHPPGLSGNQWLLNRSQGPWRSLQPDFPRMGSRNWRRP